MSSPPSWLLPLIMDKNQYGRLDYEYIDYESEFKVTIVAEVSPLRSDWQR